MRPSTTICNCESGMYPVGVTGRARTFASTPRTGGGLLGPPFFSLQQFIARLQINRNPPKIMTYSSDGGVCRMTSFMHASAAGFDADTWQPVVFRLRISPRTKTSYLAATVGPRFHPPSGNGLSGSDVTNWLHCVMILRVRSVV